MHSRGACACESQSQRIAPRGGSPKRTFPFIRVNEIPKIVAAAASDARVCATGLDGPGIRAADSCPSVDGVAAHRLHPRLFLDPHHDRIPQRPDSRWRSGLRLSRIEPSGGFPLCVACPETTALASPRRIASASLGPVSKHAARRTLLEPLELGRPEL
eukprot:scaffold32423_cov140-Isochrysis_galbana.AAC.4